MGRKPGHQESLFIFSVLVWQGAGAAEVEYAKILFKEVYRTGCTFPEQDPVQPWIERHPADRFNIDPNGDRQLRQQRLNAIFIPIDRLLQALA